MSLYFISFLLIASTFAYPFEKVSKRSAETSKKSVNQPILTNFTLHEETIMKKILLEHENIESPQELLNVLKETDKAFHRKVEFWFNFMKPKAKDYFKGLFPVFWKFLVMREKEPDMDEVDIEKAINLPEAEMNERFHALTHLEKASTLGFYSILYEHAFPTLIKQ